MNQFEKAKQLWELKDPIWGYAVDSSILAEEPFVLKRLKNPNLSKKERRNLMKRSIFLEVGRKVRGCSSAFNLVFPF